MVEKMTGENNKQPINANSVAREFALRFIYHFQLDYFSKEGSGKVIDSNELVHKINIFKETIDLNVPETSFDFCKTLIVGVATNIDELGTTIENYLENWRLSRLHSVDLSILYIATYEMLFYKKTPPKVVINEALNLAKSYSTKEAPAFLNGVLDRIWKAQS